MWVIPGGTCTGVGKSDRMERTPQWGYHSGPLEPNPARDLWETVWHWVKKRAKVFVHQLPHCGVKVGVGEESSLISHPHVHGQRKPQCPKNT